MLRAEGLSYWIEDSVLLHEVNVNFEPNRFHVIMGANGAGKTTFLKVLAGHLRPSEGGVYLFDKHIQSYTKKELATKRAVLSQHYQIAFPIAASDVVMMGRYPYYGNSPRQQDISICAESIQLMESSGLTHREYNTLSGGEAQKIQMSRVLAQIWEAKETDQKILFLDEPVSHLDLKYQHQLLETAKKLCKRNVTIIAILHDINLALRYADRILFLKQGKLVREIEHMSAVTPQIIKEVFDIDAKVLDVTDERRVVVF